MMAASARPASSSAPTKFVVLLAQRAELGDAEVFLVEAPAGELRLSGGCGGVGVLHSDEPVAPAVGQRGRAQIDTVDTEAVSLLEG